MGGRMKHDKARKITFYADEDVKQWLDQLDSGSKSRMINTLLRQGLGDRDKGTFDMRFNAIDARLRKLEKDVTFDGFSIAALRRVLLNRFGKNSEDEFKKEYDDFYFGYGGKQPPRE